MPIKDSLYSNLFLSRRRRRGWEKNSFAFNDTGRNAAHECPHALTQTEAASELSVHVCADGFTSAAG